MNDKRLTLKFGLNMCAVDSVALPPDGQVAILVPMSYGANLVCNSEGTAAAIALAIGSNTMDYTDAGRPVVMVAFEMDKTDGGLQQVRDLLKSAGFDVTEDGRAPWLQMLKARQS